MPLDVRPNSAVNHAMLAEPSETTAGAQVARFLGPWNALPHRGTMLPTLASGYANPSSELASAPASALWHPRRRRRYISGQTWVLTSTTDEMWDRPNAYTIKARLNGGGAFITCDLRTSTPTTVITGEALEARAQERMRTLIDSGFVVLFDSWHRNSVNPTHRWSITHPTLGFDIDVTGDSTSILPAWDITSDFTNISGTAGFSPRFHTEEWIVFDLGPPEYRDSVNLPAALWRWAQLIDPGFELDSDVEAFASLTPGSRKVRLYISDTLAGADMDADPTTHASNTDHLRARRILRSGTAEDYVDSNGHIYRVDQVAPVSGSVPNPRLVLTDCTDQGLAVPAGQLGHSYRYVRLHIVDPTNFHGRLSLGGLNFGPAWFPHYNHSWDWSLEVIDNDIVRRTRGGDFWIEPRRRSKRARLSWSTSLLTGHDYAMLMTYVLGATHSPGGYGVQDDRAVLEQPHLVFFPGHQPIDPGLAHGSVGWSAVLGRSQFGRMTEHRDNIWRLSSWTIDEEPPG